MFRWPTAVGGVIGLGIGLCILTLADGGRRGPPPSGPILSECDGRFRELVIHYEPGAKAIVTPVYHDFLGALDGDVTVHVVCPDRPAFEDLVVTVGQVRCQLRAVLVQHPLTTWSRDRWVALVPAVRGGPTTLLSPRGEAAEAIWPARAGDEQVGQDLAAALAPSVRARRSGLYFDGGDFLADSDRVFVVPRVMQRNLQHTVVNRDELLEVLSRELKRRVLVLDEAPDHHAGMFMVSAGHRRMLVGDPSLGRRFAAGQALTSLPGGPDFSPETQHRFDAVAARCAAAGYQVARLPTVPAGDGRTYLTYANVLVDEQGGRRIVYLPFYRGFETLNAAARVVWEELGYAVRLVDCTGAFRHFGSLHCLVNVLRRASGAGPEA